jgi:hypothetical protein
MEEYGWAHRRLDATMEERRECEKKDARLKPAATIAIRWIEAAMRFRRTSPEMEEAILASDFDFDAEEIG